MIILMFVTALMLSGIAAWYAIAGLMAIFAAAAIPIAIMGGTLEISKLVVASWLYRNWKEVPKLLKTYFCVALLVLMTLTSMGIFGYLSKAHLDQGVPTAEIAQKLELIDEKIKNEKEIINENRKTLAQLDLQINETITRTANDTTDKGIRRSISARKAQAKERAEIKLSIESSQKKIASYQEERAPIASQLREVEAEVGPIKYIAALIYGDNPDQNLLEKAVRVVILMIVAVFDPLAVLMLVAANWSLVNIRKKKEPKYELDDGPITEEQIDEIKNQVDVDDVQVKGLFDEPKMDWDPSLYKGLDDPDVNDEIIKLFEGDDIIKSPAPPPKVEPKTIVEEVDEIQQIIEYDSAGRRITPNKNKRK